MSTKRLWLIAGSAVAAVAIIVLVLIAVFPPSAEPTATPSPSASATITPSPTPTASASPTPTSTLPASVVATCENTSTAAFRALAASSGSVSWQTQNEQIGARPFDTFPNGTPEGAIVCRWGEGPEIATDNVTDLAWAPLGSEDTVASITKLSEAGYSRIDAADGRIFMAMPADPSFADAEGWGDTYLFTFDDVRWAQTKAAVTDYVKAPTEAE